MSITRGMATKTKDTITDAICEGFSNSGATIDRDASVIRGVKLIGFESKNGRSYPASVLRTAVEQYEGKRVNLDHPERSAVQSRSIKDRIGTIKSAKFVEGKGVYGDLHFNPKHQYAEQILWAAEHDPGSIGFSHNATVQIKPGTGGKAVVESISSVRHVDLVADPATTNGVFESEQVDDTETTEEHDMDLSKLTLEELKIARPDLIQAVESVATTAATKAADEKHKPVLEELTQLKSDAAQRKLQDAVEAEIRDSKIDPKHVSDVFRKQLLATESVEARKEMLADRAALASGKQVKPTTVTESTDAPAALDRKSLVSCFRS